jgi:hypothetical protein
MNRFRVLENTVRKGICTKGEANGRKLREEGL